MRRETLLLRSPCALALALVFSACDFGGESPKPDPDAATIRELTVEPNPVAVGDTALFTCIVASNTRAELRFEWNPPGLADIARTDTNQFRWPVTVSPGDYRLTVEVDRTDGAFSEVQGVVEFTVIARE